MHNIVTVETVLPVAKRRSPKWSAGASAAALGGRSGSIARSSVGIGWVIRAASSGTTNTPADSVRARKPGETPPTIALAAGE